LVQKVIHHAVKNGVVTDWFLMCPQAIRIAPPLIISDSELEKACDILINALDML